MTTKSVEIRLAAMTRVEYIEVLLVPADMSEAELSELVQQRYKEIDGGLYTNDPDYWEQGACYACKADEGSPSPTGSVSRNSDGGFEVAPDVWAVQMCRVAGILLVHDDQRDNRWEWVANDSASSDDPGIFFETETDAARDALEVIFAKAEWRREVSEGNTRLGYDEWVLHSAESYADDHAPAKARSPSSN